MPQELGHPSYLGWQIDWPVFVKMPFTAFGKYWKKGELFNWHSQITADPKKIATLYASGYIYHNKEFTKEQKVGDRLGEMNSEQLYRVVSDLNAHLKKNVATTQEFNKKKCKLSKIDDKQRGLLRSFLRQQPWIVDYFYEIRDTVLGE